LALETITSMRILYYDCFTGISGDMNLGALIDAGVPSEYLTGELKKLDVEGYRLETSESLKMGISGIKVIVELAHDHDHHSHGHHSHDHRNLSQINDIIRKSSLSSFVKERSTAIFLEIAQAEAKIHSKPIDEIHFHEVGATDSIVDIVGAAICIEYLRPDKILASPVELGGGFVECAHGTFPVPAPATAEILRGIPVRTGAADTETTTPTGAAILKVFVDEFRDKTEFAIQKVAYGIGHKDLSIPNVLRVFIGEMTEAGKYEDSQAVQIECNIDDMNPEQYDYIMNRLFEAGAHDVFLIPMIMKKSRPAIMLKVLCSLSDKDAMVNLILAETTSIGIRWYPVTKTMLERFVRTIETSYGPIKIKEAKVSGKSFKFKAEYDDCVAAARINKVSLRDIYEEVERCMQKNK
jgi:pyridinium-3,5-bisthiocarboxylic acid mononucleotide nickel chelatase